MDRDILIHKYLHQTLNEEERKELESLLENDSGFKETFELEKDLHAVLIDSGKEHLKQQFVDFENKELEETSETSSPSFLRYAIIACIIIGLSVFISKSFINTTNTDDLFAQNFEPYQNIVKPIERGEGIDTSQEEAFFKYEMKDYTIAIKGFEAEFEKTKESYYLFYTANAYLALDNPKKAIPLLEKHQSFKDDFYEKSRWYLALAYLKEKNTDKSKELLQEISDSEEYNYNKAAVLLKTIR